MSENIKSRSTHFKYLKSKFLGKFQFFSDAFSDSKPPLRVEFRIEFYCECLGVSTYTPKIRVRSEVYKVTSVSACTSL